MLALARPYLHQLSEGRCPEVSEDPSLTAELLGTVLGSTAEEVTVVAVVPIVVFTGGTTGVLLLLLLLLAHTPSPVVDIQLSD
jgi:N-glycosylase/DNA lyase